MTCPHLDLLSAFQPPRLSQSVQREECTQCFDNQDLPGGIDVCLTCFNGGCSENDRNHAGLHFSKSSHPFTLNIRRFLKPTAKRGSDEEPPAKRLAIIEEREEDKYTHKTELKCWLCDGAKGKVVEDGLQNPKAQELNNAVMSSLSAARQSEVKAWEEEFEACEHTVMLQPEPRPILESGFAHCSKCDLKENLWLCLTCGALGCGRQQFGGVAGNGHALAHFQESLHAAAVKLGTITPEGQADVYCYACDDTKLDLELAAHLGAFGINVAVQQKTEKTMTELQIDQNFNYEFSLTDENGKAFQPVFGPGLTGLSNLGNSCYMASVLQTLFALQPFRNAYQDPHYQSCHEPLPAACVQCQIHKISDGLLSGRYSHPRAHLPESTSASPSPDEPVFQVGLRPSMFKALIGKGHPEFATMRQQDAEEFLSHLIKVLRTDAKKRGIQEDKLPVDKFRFGMEQRLQCGDCKRVRYKWEGQDALSVVIPAKEIEKPDREEGDKKREFEAVAFEECLKQLTQPEALEYRCPSCQKTVIAQKRTSFSSFPDILAVHAKKFQLVNWVPTKLEIPVLVPDDLQLDQYLGGGLQAGEESLPEDGGAGPKVAQPSFDPEAIAQLQQMGFPLIRCQKALLAVPGNIEGQMDWLFAHMEDPDIDSPLPVSRAGDASSDFKPSDEAVESLTMMGFTTAQAKKALRETKGDVERAVDWLFSHPDDTGDTEPQSSTSAAAAPKTSTPQDLGGSSALPASYRLKAFISHKGPSVHSGHYVAHIRYDEDWVLFNDEKVVKADAESVTTLKKLAYLYVFERV